MHCIMLDNLHYSVALITQLFFNTGWGECIATTHKQSEWLQYIAF